VITEAHTVFSNINFGLSVRISMEKHSKKQREVVTAAVCKERRVMDCNKGHIIAKMNCTISVSAEEKNPARILVRTTKSKYGWYLSMYPASLYFFMHGRGLAIGPWL
jgi:hypothetical protein